ncbi:MAG: hypothetical protein JWQ23_2562 [Herminiimonas sp.]|nr:hypothetical protein [Herminiimonas sp.]
MDDPAGFKPDAVFDPHAAPGGAFLRDLARVRRRLNDTRDLADLQRASGDIRNLLQQVAGVAAPEPATRLISSLSDALTRRVIKLIQPGCAGMQADQPAWCWIALGSEGRQEQTLASDQDNSIIFADVGAGADAEDAIRARLLPLALCINEALADCGFPLCSGEIMASNPQCCLSLREWRHKFSSWMIEGDPQALLNATIFFDLRPLYGACTLAQALIDWLAANAADSPRFLFQMTENALQREAPLGMLRDFMVEKGGRFAGTIDLKLQAATLFVDAARIYGLACRSRSSNTAQRFKAAREMQQLEPDEVNTWMRAFYLIQMLRLANQQRCGQFGIAMHNHVDPNQLNAPLRRSLLAALREARGMQKRLAQSFIGNTAGI